MEAKTELKRGWVWGLLKNVRILVGVRWTCFESLSYSVTGRDVNSELRGVHDLGSSKEVVGSVSVKLKVILINDNLVPTSFPGRWETLEMRLAWFA